MTESTPRDSARKKPFLSLLTDVPHLVIQLVRAEIELLKAELTAKLKATGIGLGLFAIAISLITFALLLLVFCGSIRSRTSGPFVGRGTHQRWCCVAPCDGGSAGGSRRDVSREEPEA